MKLGFVIFWIITSMAGVIYLHRLHYLPVAQAVVHSERSTHKLTLNHFLSPECKCSHLLKDHFIKRGPSNYKEKIFIIKTHDQTVNNKIYKPLKEAGFETEFIVEERVTGVPLLVIQNEDKENLYVGGYTEGQIRPDSNLLDIQIARDLEMKKNIQAYSPLGCPVSEKLKKYIDPIGVKGL